jgi:hypothetical protein
MKKNVLTLAVAGAVAASAQAQMYLNPDNTGEVLIYPFYSADNGNETYIHVVNTTDLHKAAKVRIIEAENSQEVRDFNLYLSPYDHFAFVIQLDESGGGKLLTGDTSCTVPAIPADGIEFTNLLFADDVNDSLERTLNGYVEIIEMGQFYGAAQTTAALQAQNPGWYWEHTAEGVPNSCDTVVSLWASNGQWYKDQATNGKRGVYGQLTDWAGGGLYGMGIIVNVDAGAAVGYDAVAIEEFVDDSSAAKGAALHYYPGDVLPGLDGRENITATSATIFDNGAADDYAFTAPAAVGKRDAITDTLHAVTGMLMVDTISNDYVLDPFFAGETDWVVTFPTKRLYVAEDGTTGVVTGTAPFNDEWDTNESCDNYGITVYDREEQTPIDAPGQPVFSPYVPGKAIDPLMCYEANVLTFAKAGEAVKSPLLGETPSASGERIQIEIGTPYDNGWAMLDFVTTITANQHAVTATADATDDTTIRGLPAVGFSVIAFGNDSVQGGVLANYAAAHEHKTTRNIS